MAEPIEWLIVQDLQAALRAISLAGGYHFDVAPEAVKLNPDASAETLIAPVGGPRPFLFVEWKDDAWEYVERPNGILLVLPITVWWVQDFDPTDDASLMRTFLRGCADVEKAVAVDITRGGHAYETRIVRRTPQVEGASELWAIVDLEILVRRTYGQPNA